MFGSLFRAPARRGLVRLTALKRGRGDAEPVRRLGLHIQLQLGGFGHFVGGPGWIPDQVDRGVGYALDGFHVVGHLDCQIAHTRRGDPEAETSGLRSCQPALTYTPEVIAPKRFAPITIVAPD